MSFLLPGINQQILQMAYVVNDLETAAKRWTETFGIGPFLVMERPAINNPIYRGKPGGVEFSVAVAQAGDIHIELIEQHCSSPSCYRDVFPEGQEGFHHIAVIVEDYDAEMARYQSAGIAEASSGSLGPLRFAYMDTVATLGCMTEVLEDVPMIRAHFANIAAAARDWDGKNAFRSM